MITEKDIKNIKFEKSKKGQHIAAIVLILIAVSGMIYIFEFYAPEKELKEAREGAVAWSSAQVSVNEGMKKSYENKAKVLEKNYYKISDYCRNDIEVIWLFKQTIDENEAFNSTCGTDCKISKSGMKVYIERSFSDFAWNSDYDLSSLSAEMCTINYAEKMMHEIMENKINPYASRAIVMDVGQKSMVFSEQLCEDFATMANVFDSTMIGLMESDYGYREILIRTKTLNVTINRTYLVSLNQYTILNSINRDITDAYKVVIENFYDDIIKNYNKAKNKTITEAFDASMLLKKNQLDIFRECKFTLSSKDINELVVENNYRTFLSLYSQGKHMEALKNAIIVAGYEIATGAM